MCTCFAWGLPAIHTAQPWLVYCPWFDLGLLKCFTQPSLGLCAALCGSRGDARSLALACVLLLCMGVEVMHIPYTTLYITHPLTDFPRSISPQSQYSIGARKVGVRNISPRAFRRRAYRSVLARSFVVEQSSLENRARGGGVCVMYTVLCGGLAYSWQGIECGLVVAA